MPVATNRVDHILQAHYDSKIKELDSHILFIVGSNIAIFALLLIVFTALFCLLALIPYITNLCARFRHDGAQSGRDNPLCGGAPRGGRESPPLTPAAERGSVPPINSEHPRGTRTSTHSTTSSTRAIPIPRPRSSQYGEDTVGNLPTGVTRPQRFHNGFPQEDYESWGTIWSDERSDRQ